MSISASAREQFLGVWPSLRDELVEYMQGEKMPKDAVDWFRSVSSWKGPQYKASVAKDTL